MILLIAISNPRTLRIAKKIQLIFFEVTVLKTQCILVALEFQDLKVEASVHVGSRALPTIPNFIFNMTEALLGKLRIFPGRRKKYSILNKISGIINPSSSGKTTLLLALAGRLVPGLKMSGRINYNGHELNELVAQRTSAYVSQRDWHIAEMTVRETLELSGRCQGFGFKQDMLMELLRREKDLGIELDDDLDIFIKSIALGDQRTSLVVDYIIKGVPGNWKDNILDLIIALACSNYIYIRDIQGEWRVIILWVGTKDL